MVAIAEQSTFSAIEQGLVLEIEEVWARSNLQDTYPASFRALGEYAGKSYFLPVAHTWTAMYYPSQLFEEYDLTPPETWDELLAVCETLWFSGVTPIALAGGDFWSVSMWFDYLNLRLNGPEFYTDLTQGEIPYDDPRVAAVFEAWAALLEHGCFGDDTSFSSPLRGLDAIMKGEAAMMLASPVQMQDLPGPWLEQLAFFPFPSLDPTVPTAEVAPTFGYLIPAGTQHPAEATEFLAYLGSPEVQQGLAQELGPNLGVMPVHTGVDPATFTPETREGWRLVREADAISQPYIFAVPESMARAASGAFRQFLLDPEKVDEALNSLEKARQETFGE
jgi:multiple sugar transport system substrate-binding protein/raffinose/stachyose/melibiose transport system substrate-binding protein